MGEEDRGDAVGITERHVQQQLAQRFIGLAHTHVAPGAQLHLPWIADLITVTRTGMVVENEIKLSRSDFKADFLKRKKHELLEAGDPFREELRAVEYPPYPRLVVYRMLPPKSPIIPNYFRYVCPEEIITREELPPYAGLITFRVCWEDAYGRPGECRLIFHELRRAPKIHAEPITLAQRNQLSKKPMHRLLGNSKP